MKWYAIHTYSGHENKVKGNLERAIATSGIEDHGSVASSSRRRSSRR